MSNDVDEGGGGDGFERPTMMMDHNSAVAALLIGGARLFWREKNIKCFFPATTEQNITRVNFLRKPSESFILMAINALVAIPSEHLLCRAKF